MTEFSPEAHYAIQAIFDDPALDQLAERIDEMLDLLDKDHGDPRLRKFRMQSPRLWMIRIHGSNQDFVLLWDTDGPDDEPFVRYAGEAF